nr:MAG TPA: hypothetical protein [Caudoviricetes sp.]
MPCLPFLLLVIKSLKNYLLLLVQCSYSSITGRH